MEVQCRMQNRLAGKIAYPAGFVACRGDAMIVARAVQAAGGLH